MKQYADKPPRDGKITINEWEEWLNQTQTKNKFLLKHKKIDGALQIVSYAPQRSCCPPPVFVAGITIIQVLFYILS